MVEEKDFRRGELLENYMAKILYEQDNKKFKEVRKKLIEVEVCFLRKEILKSIMAITN